MPVADEAPEQPTVLAVLVAHDGAVWLPEALAALMHQTVAPTRVIAVDTGSTDATAALLAEAEATGVVHEIRTVSRQTGFGAAVDVVLADAPATTYVWLLHDDVAPEPGALEALLAYAEESPSTALLGPKVRDWHDPRLLVEIGVTTDGAGHRDLGLDRHEYDQGQHDVLRDVLAVGTAAALVRRSAWEQVGGIDPRLPVFRDDLDLGWRLNAAGHRVVVVPQACVRHVRAATTGRRVLDAAHGRAEGIDRRHALQVLFAHAPLWALPLLLVRLVLTTVLRAAGFLLTRQPLLARDELAAAARLLLRPDLLVRAHRERARSRTVPRSQLRPLFATRRARLRARLQQVGAWLEGERQADPVNPLGALGDSGPDSDDAFDVDAPAATGLLVRLLWRPSVLLVLLLALLTSIVARQILPPGEVLVGGRLLPAPDGARELWNQFTSAWHPVSVGSDAPASPALALLGALSSALLGKAWLAVDVVVLGSIPLGGLSAYLATRSVVRRWQLRVWAAVTWALLPAATGAIAMGRLDAAVAQVALPPLLLSGARLVSRDPAVAGWRHAWALGLLLAVTAAFAPLCWPLAVLLLAGAAVVGLVRCALPSAWLGSDRPAVWPAVRRLVAAAVAGAVPIALLFPWSTHLLRHPDLALAGPGRLTPDPSFADPSLSGLDLLLLRPGGDGMLPLWVTVGLLLAALGGLLRTARQPLAQGVWAAGLVALGVALVLAHTSVTIPETGRQAAVWPGSALQVAAGLLLVAALIGGEDLRTRLASMSFGWRQLMAGVVAVVAALGPVAAVLSWLADGVDGPVARGEESVLPAFVAAELQAEPGLRALALRAGSPVSYSLVSGRGEVLGDADTAIDPGQRRALDAVVSTVLTPSGSNAAEGLSTRAVRYVLLPVVPATPETARLTTVLDGQPGLVRRGRGDVLLWQVTAPSSRFTLLPPDTAIAALRGATAPTTDQVRSGAITPLAGAGRVSVPVGADGRVLVLSEAGQRGWRAELDGRPLEEVVAWGWAAAFRVPAEGGEVTVRFAPQDDRRTDLWIELAAVGVVTVLALPGVRRRRGLEVVDGAAAEDAVPDEQVTP